MTDGNIVLLHGTVTGPGKLAGCEVLPRRITADDGNGLLPRPYAFTDCSVIGAPADLPDGECTTRSEVYSFTAAAIVEYGSHATLPPRPSRPVRS